MKDVARVDDDQQTLRVHIAEMVDISRLDKLNRKTTVRIEQILPSRKHADITVFSLAGSADDSNYAYIKAKTSSKFRSFEVISALDGKELGLPRVYFMNRATQEAIVEWFSGEQLAYFDRTSKDQQPRVTDADLFSILESVVRLHTITSRQFSDLSPAPRLPETAASEALRSLSEYPRMIPVWYAEATPWLKAGVVMKNLKPDILKQCRYLVGVGGQFIEDSLPVLDKVESFSLLHGDLHPENIVKTQEGVRFVDFEHMHFGDRAAELAYFFEQGAQAGYIDEARRQLITDKYVKMLEVHERINDQDFSQRALIHQVYATLKFLGLLCGGYTSPKPGEVNAILLQDVMERATNLLKSVKAI